MFKPLADFFHTFNRQLHLRAKRHLPIPPNPSTSEYPEYSDSPQYDYYDENPEDEGVDYYSPEENEDYEILSELIIDHYNGSLELFTEPIAVVDMVWKDMQKWFEDPETFYDDVENWWKDFYGEVDSLATSIGNQFEDWWWQLNAEGRKIDRAIADWFEKDVVNWFEGPVKDFFEGPVADAVHSVGNFFHGLFSFGFGGRKKREVSSIPSPDPFPRFRRGLRNLLGRMKRPRTNSRPNTASRPKGGSRPSNPRPRCNCPCRRRKPTPTPSKSPLTTTLPPNPRSQPFDSQSYYPNSQLQSYNSQSYHSNPRSQNPKHAPQKNRGISKLMNYCNMLPHITVYLNRAHSQPQLLQSIPTPVLLDTGSTVSLISKELVRYLGLIINPSRLTIQGLGGKRQVEGVTLLSVTIGQPPNHQTHGVQAYVIPSGYADTHLLLGVNFLGAVGKNHF